MTRSEVPGKAANAPRLRPMYFIGDSNVMIFSYLYVYDPKHFAVPFVGRSLFCPKLTIADLMTAADFDERFLRALVAEHLVIQNASGEYVAWHKLSLAREHALSVGELLGRSTADIDKIVSPPITIMLGSLDLAWILEELGPNTDFLIDDPRFDAAAFEGDAEVAFVPIALARRLVEIRLRSFGAAIRKLVDLGFDRLYVHSLTPPTANDARYYRWRQIHTQASVRSKVSILLNARMKEIAMENGASFIDMWDAVARDGVLAPEFSLDGDHFNKAAALLTTERLMISLASRASEPEPIADHLLLSILYPAEG